MSEHWSQYWEQGHLTSFGESFSLNYTGVLRSVWLDTFAMLPNEFSVLDIATGNGALPLLIQESHEGSDIKGSVTGIDLADVKPLELSEGSLIKLKLQSRIDCCELPFNEATFDLVTSQFGIEYAPLKSAIPEAIRVLKPGGKLQVVVHHHDSMIINRNRRILKLISSEQIVDFFAILAKMIKSMGEVKSNVDLARVKQDKTAETNRLALNDLISVLVKEDEEALKDSDVMSYVATLFKTGIFWPMTKKFEYLAFAEKEISTLISRLSELVSASVSETELAKVFEIVAELGNLDEISVVRDTDNTVLAWKINICKASG